MTCVWKYTITCLPIEKTNKKKNVDNYIFTGKLIILQFPMQKN